MVHHIRRLAIDFSHRIEHKPGLPASGLAHKRTMIIPYWKVDYPYQVFNNGHTATVGAMLSFDKCHEIIASTKNHRPQDCSHSGYCTCHLVREVTQRIRVATRACPAHMWSGVSSMDRVLALALTPADEEKLPAWQEGGSCSESSKMDLD